MAPAAPASTVASSRRWSTSSATSCCATRSATPEGHLRVVVARPPPHMKTGRCVQTSQPRLPRHPRLRRPRRRCDTSRSRCRVSLCYVTIKDIISLQLGAHMCAQSPSGTVRCGAVWRICMYLGGTCAALARVLCAAPRRRQRPESRLPGRRAARGARAPASAASMKLPAPPQ